MDVVWDSLRRSQWEAAIGAAPLQQHWDYGAIAARMGASVRRARVVAADGSVHHLQCLLRRVGPLRIGWHPLPSPISDPAATSLRREGPLLWLSPSAGGLRLAGARAYAALDLTAPDLRAGLKGKWRNRLVAAERHATPVIEADHIPPWLARAEREQQKRARYRNMPAPWIERWSRRAPGNVLTLTAGPPDAPVAATAFLVHGSSATYLMGWTDDAGRALSAHNLLIWQAMSRLARRGIRALNLGRLDPATPGLNRFKLGTGAIPRHIPPPRARLVTCAAPVPLTGNPQSAVGFGKRTS